MLTAVALTTRPYVEWITETVGMLFPLEWAAFARAAERRLASGWWTRTPAG